MTEPSLWQQFGSWVVEHVPFLPEGMGPLLGALLGCLMLLFGFVMPIVTYMIWWLRKLLGWMQSRLGPQHVGYKGLLQSPADALKLMTKEDIVPSLADRLIFTIAPGIVFFSAFLAYLTIPLAPGLVVKDLHVGIIYVGAVTSVTVVGIVLAAWASNNKYALLGAFRSAAQMVSYEVPLLLAILGPVLLAESLSLTRIIEAQGPGFFAWFVFLQPVVLLCFFGAALAENNITPFDIVEAESEIVAGFHVEYSGMKFALFFLAEFANTMTVAILMTVLFFGGWYSPFDAWLRPDAWTALPLPFAEMSLLQLLWANGWFMAKVFFFISVVFWIRATLPRVRVDQLMDFGWKTLIPITLLNLFVVGAAVAFEWPLWTLAAFNWGALLVLIGLGMTKRLPQVQGIGAAGAPPPTEASQEVHR